MCRPKDVAALKKLTDIDKYDVRCQYITNWTLSHIHSRANDLYKVPTVLLIFSNQQ
jgi:hypothetical protein